MISTLTYKTHQFIVKDVYSNASAFNYLAGGNHCSFNKALPILEQGYIEAEDMPKVRRILRAAALTYLAGSMASLLNLWRWIAILRR